MTAPIGAQQHDIPMSQRLLVSSLVSLPQSALTNIACEVIATGFAFDMTKAGDVLLVPAVQAESLIGAGLPPQVVLVLWQETGEPVLPDLLAHERIVGVLDSHCSSDVCHAMIKAALALAVARGQVNAGRMLQEVLEIGRALASEKELDVLFGLILGNAGKLTNADGASLYTVEDKQLRFRVWQNSSMTVDVSEKRIVVGDDSIAGYVARTGAALMLVDAYMIPPDAPYRFNPAYDRETNYRTRSLLTVPLKNKADEVVGVLQLVNRKTDGDVLLKETSDFGRFVLPFTAQDEAIALALAGQAGVALENSLLYADIERLFEGFITASVQAIEARDPVTAGHSFRVAEFTERFAKAVDRTDRHGLRQVVFSRAELRELRYAALLHDFGKVGVKENVLTKSKKLYPLQLEVIQARFKHLRSALQKEAYRRLLDMQEQQRLDAKELVRERRSLEVWIESESARLEEYWDVILRANEPTVCAQDVAAALSAVAAYQFRDEQTQEELVLLSPFEFNDLSIAQGNLAPDERAQIESHVSHTYSFLSLIPWTRELARLPEIAYAHHEKVDGTGYPRGLADRDIPIQSRMLSIADIYDALTACDRPYKVALPHDRALDILREEARRDKIDRNLLEIFIEAGAYRL